MSYFGRHQLGEEIRLQVFCRAADGSPAFPTAAPILDVWFGSTKVFSGLTLFPTDRLNVVGLFLRPIRLSNLSNGMYNCVFRWQIGSFNGVGLGSFEVVNGGNSNGDCLSMVYYNPPNGQFLVRQTSAGVLLQGKNPQPN